MARDPVKVKAAKARYAASEKGQAAALRYRTSEKGRAAQARADAKPNIVASRRRRRGVTNASGERRTGPCDLCGRHIDGLHQDHDHVTGMARGWLCNGCNLGLGQLGDTVENLQRAVDYLTVARTAHEASCSASPQPHALHTLTPESPPVAK